MSKVRIVVAYHKQWPKCVDDIYCPIQVGAINASSDLGIQRDDDGDNISDKNPYYSEVTALYYLWKNVQADYKGLCHYRRYFCLKNEPIGAKVVSGLIGSGVNLARVIGKKVHYTNQHYVFLPYDVFVERVHSEEEVLSHILENYSIVATIPTSVLSTVREHFVRIIGERPIDELDKLMSSTSFNDIYREMLEGSEYYSGNMSIMKSALFEEYCGFLFPLLEKHLKELLKESQNPKEFLRVSGYIAEILTSVFIMSKRKKERIFEAPVYYVDEANKLTRLGSFLVKIGFFHPQFIK